MLFLLVFVHDSQLRTHGHGQQCGDWVGEGGIREVKGNGKKYNKNNLKKIS